MSEAAIRNAERAASRPVPPRLRRTQEALPEPTTEILSALREWSTESRERTTSSHHSGAGGQQREAAESAGDGREAPGADPERAALLV